MTQKTSTYNPAEVTVSILGNTITGFADGQFIEVSRNSKTFEKYVGVDGEVTRVMQHDRSGNIKLTLTQSSDSNITLTTLQQTDENTGKGTFPILIKDGGGGRCGGTVAWVDGPPKVTYNKGVEVREWNIAVAYLAIVPGNLSAI